MMGFGKRDLILPKLKKKVIVDIGLVHVIHFPYHTSSTTDFWEKVKQL